jgi:L-fucose dehydrogenase
MDLNLQNKVVVVTGGAGKKGSIGETLVRHIAREGGIPAIIDRNARGHDSCAALQAAGTDAHFVQTDLTDPASCRSAVEQIAEKYGRIDVVVNNVGVNDGIGLDNSAEEFIDSLRLNLVSYFLITKYALPFLKASKGNIINIASKVAMTGQGGTSGYAASKGGVLALTREWAVDLLPFGIRSNAVVVAESWTPAYEDWLGTFADPLQELQKINSKIPLGNRMTKPEEIANMVLFLAADLSAHTTGQFVHIDGGYVHLDRKIDAQANNAVNENAI